MKVLLFSIIFACGALVLVSPDVVSAQQIVPCYGDDECTVCDVVELGQNIINFFVIFSVIVAALLFVNAGVLYVFSPANPGNISKAHRIFTNALVGLIIILTSWLVVDTVMKMLYGGGWGPWNEILCKAGPQGPATPEIEPPTTPPVTPPTALCDDEPALAASYGVPVTPGNSSSLNQLINCFMANPQVASLVDRSQIFTIEQTNRKCNLTRGYPVCGSCAHGVNSCHYGGGSGSNGAEAVDFNAIGGREQDLYNALLNARTCVGLGAKFNFETNHTHVSTRDCDRL